MGNHLNKVTAEALGRSIAVKPRVPSLFEPPPVSLSARFTAFPSLKAERETRLDPDHHLPSRVAPLALKHRLREDHVRPANDVNDERFSIARNASSHWQSRAAADLAPGQEEVHGGDRQGTSERQERQTDDQPKPLRIIGRKRKEAPPTGPAVSTVREADVMELAPKQLCWAEPGITPALSLKPEGKEPEVRENKQEARADFRRFSSQRQKTSGVGPRSQGPVLQEQQSAEDTVRDSGSDRARRDTVFWRRETVASTERPALRVPALPVAELKKGEETTPNISVVIGRVSVQAVMPQPAPARLVLPPPAPLLSLEQYMKQRGGQS